MVIQKDTRYISRPENVTEALMYFVNEQDAPVQSDRREALLLIPQEEYGNPFEDPQ